MASISFSEMEIFKAGGGRTSCLGGRGGGADVRVKGGAIVGRGLAAASAALVIAAKKQKSECMELHLQGHGKTAR